MDQIPEFYQPHHHRRTAIRIIKSKAGHYGLPIFHFDADFFLEAVNDPHFCYETDNEFVVYVEHSWRTLVLQPAPLIPKTSMR